MEENTETTETEIDTTDLEKEASGKFLKFIITKAVVTAGFMIGSALVLRKIDKTMDPDKQPSTEETTE